MELTRAQRVELFHLAFLQVFLVGERKQRCILKGGANLRYFFHSVRYSNDLDLDVDAPEGWQLERAVDGALSSAGLTRILEAAGLRIELDSISKPKQTLTTRRWRLGLIDPSERGSHVIRTKIEFSARDDGSGDQEFAPVPASVVRPYGLIAPTVMHYRLGAALEQKVAALAERSETKARDVFDLDLLFRIRDTVASPSVLVAPMAAAAVDRCLALIDEDFEIQVAPFLDAEVAPVYSGRWTEIRELVAERLWTLDPPEIDP